MRWTCRLGWDLGLQADQVEAQKKLSDEKPHLLIFESHVFGFLPVAGAQHKPDRLAELLERGRRVTWSLHAVWQNRRSSEVDAFSSSILGRRHRGMSRA